MASIRKRGETYHITVSLGVDENYKQERKFTTYTPPHGLTPKQGKKAAQEYARVFELKCNGLTAYDENMTLSELCEWYFKNIAPNRTKERTIENNIWRLNHYVLPKLGRKKLKELKPAMLAAHFTDIRKNGGYGVKYRIRGDYDLKAAIHARGETYLSFIGDEWNNWRAISNIIRGYAIRRETGERITERLGIPFEMAFEVIRENAALAPNTVKGVQMALNTVFNAAVKAEIMTINPLTNVDMPKVGEIYRPSLTTEQARVFLRNLSNVKHIGVRAILITELFTGARTGELRALTWDDVNLHLVDAMGEYGLVNISKSADNKKQNNAA
jgi:integrase